MDIGKNFTFVTEDEAWIKKILICAACFLPLVNLVGIFAFYGYLKKFFKNAVEGQERPLPEWDDFMGYIVEGLKTVVVVLGYMFPFVLLYIGAVVINIAAAASRTPALNFVGTGCICLAIPVGILLGLMMNIGLMRFFVTDSIGEAFKFGEVIGFLKGNLGQYLLAFVLFFVAIIAAEIVGIIACVVGIFVTLPYAMLVGWKMFADVWRNAQAQAPAM
jgi:hypothetical protein